MDIITPPPLLPGDMIGVMAPSSRISRASIEESEPFFRSRGYKVFIHPQTYLHADSTTQLAGTIGQKRDALHDLIKDETVKAVFFAAGGQRAIGLLNAIDYDLISANPKIFMGFSDNTSILNAITAKTGIVTYHGPTFKNAVRNPQIDFNLRLLAGQENSILLAGAKILKEGSAQGRLSGGNLAIFSSLLQSDYINPEGCLLFLEDIGEEMTTIDRNFWHLRRSGILKKISGLILGQFTELKDSGTPFGMSLEDIIQDHIRDLHIPVLTNAPFGHGGDLSAFPLGAAAKLVVTSDRATLDF